MTKQASQLDRESAIARAERWCRDCVPSCYLTENKSGAHATDVKELLLSFPSLNGTTWEALLWLRVGLINRSHDLVQDSGSGLEAYIHGMIHRLEGDYWNAKYWFRNAGKRVTGQITEHVNAAEPSKSFDPNQIVDRLEQYHRTGNPAKSSEESSGLSEELALRSVLEREWWAVWSIGKT